MKDTITVDEYKAIIKQNKYRNRRVVVNGIKFQSKAEAEFYKILWFYNILHRRQVKYEIKINGQLICYYYADFVIPVDEFKNVVIDVKGVETKEFKIKRKLMKAVLGVDVIVIKMSEFMSWALLLKSMQSPEKVKF